MTDLDDPRGIATEIIDDVVALRRDIHRHPELGLDNPETRDRVLAALDDLPLDVRLGVDCTSVVADLAGTTDCLLYTSDAADEGLV